MRPKTLSFLTGFIIFAVCFFFIPTISSYLQKSFSLEEKRVLFVPPLNYVELISGSFKSFCADIFYIRGILSITDKFENRLEWVEWVQNNFGLAVSLDPKLTEAYFFAGVVITEDEGSIRKGITFLEKYKYLNYLEWRIHYWIGFNYYQLGDYLKAAQYYQLASSLPGARPFLKSNQPMLYYKAGRADLGIAYLEGLLNSTKGQKQLEWIKTKLEWLKNIVLLEKKISEFEVIYGYVPESLNDLVKYKLITEIPQDPFGQGYYLDSKSGRVKSKFGPAPGDKAPKNGACPQCAE